MSRIPGHNESNTYRRGCVGCYLAAIARAGPSAATPQWNEMIDPRLHVAEVSTGNIAHFHALNMSIHGARRIYT